MKRKRKAEQHNLDLWNNNPFPRKSTSDFALSNPTEMGHNLFFHMEKTIQAQVGGTIFEQGTMEDFKYFASKWSRKIVSQLLNTSEVKRQDGNRTEHWHRKGVFKSRLPQGCNLTTSIENVYFLTKHELNYWPSFKKKPKNERKLGAVTTTWWMDMKLTTAEYWKKWLSLSTIKAN